ncbi:hypothetical protein BRAS3843_720018 [Bradyrhizobium sp. STM 3843]|nr:hypothetical protein BRAS3843_720018 [Bradyrhizobium sp. STM 3843]
MTVPVPLRADRAEAARIERRAWSRAITCRALSTPQRPAERILKANWPHDPHAEAILKAAVSPSSTTNTGLPPHDLIGAFRSLSPGSAAWKLFDHPSALKLNLAGVRTISIPHVANFPPQPVFIAEGSPGPVVQWSLMKSQVGPARKIMVLSTVSEELENASPQSVSAVIGKVLADSTNRSVDTIAFDANPGDAIRPPGLLFNVVPTVAAAAGVDAMAEDLGALVATIGAAGIDPSDTVFVAGPREAMIIKAKSGPNFDHQVFMSLGLPPKTVIACAPAGLASGYQGPPEIDTCKETVLHREDTSPGEIVSASGVPAAPSTSVFQSCLIAIRVRAECAWAAAPGAVQFVSVNW